MLDYHLPMKTVGVLVPTLFRRGEYLRLCLESLRRSSNVLICLMGPNSLRESAAFEGLFDLLIEEPDLDGLAAKIDYGLRKIPEDLEFITWLGDDDLAESRSFETSAEVLRTDSRASGVFGGCAYIDGKSRHIGSNPSFSLAVKFSRLGPFLAPQPGSLFRRSAFVAVGGLDTKYRFAFDYDLFLRLDRHGTMKFISERLAFFRWHSESLTVSQRFESTKEAAAVRVRNAAGLQRLAVRAVNPAVILLTYAAGFLAGGFALSKPFRNS